MFRKIVQLGAFLCLAAASGSVLADAEAGKAASAQCAACHGAAGISAAETFPNLAGQKKAYLVSALKAYKEKTRNAAIMNGMAAGLSDQQIDDLAAYFSSLKPGG
jgi:cytochrome c553